MPTLYITHPAYLEHITPLGHPERTDRLKAIERTLEDEKFQTLAREQAPAAAIDTIALAHPMDYVEQIREACPTVGMVRIDADTSMSPGSFEAATRGVGAATFAVDEVVGKKASNAFCAVRPPGHHADVGAGVADLLDVVHRMGERDRLERGGGGLLARERLEFLVLERPLDRLEAVGALGMAERRDVVEAGRVGDVERRHSGSQVIGTRFATDISIDCAERKRFRPAARAQGFPLPASREGVPAARVTPRGGRLSSGTKKSGASGMPGSTR